MSEPNLEKFKDSEYVKAFFADLQHHTVKKDRVVGYCHYAPHKGWLTANIADAHDCAHKNCMFLQKLDHEYWQKEELADQRKKQRKAEIKSQREKRKKTEENIQNRLKKIRNFAQNVANFYKYSILITGAKFENNDPKSRQCIINYVSDNKYNDTRRYYNIAIEIGKQYGYHCILRKIKNINGTFVNRKEYEAQKK